jgi:hypothetical protein
MVRKIFLLAFIFVFALPIFSLAQSSTATYWRDPATGIVYENRQYHGFGQNQGISNPRQETDSINREISRGGYQPPQWDYLDSQRKALEIERLRRDLDRDKK